MSWTLYGQATPGELEGTLCKAKDAQLQAQPFDSWDDDIEAQMDAAIGAAGDLAKLVAANGKVNANLTGHCKRADSDVNSLSVAVSGTLPPAAPVKK